PAEFVTRNIGNARLCPAGPRLFLRVRPGCTLQLSLIPACTALPQVQAPGLPVRAIVLSPKAAHRPCPSRASYFARPWRRCPRDPAASFALLPSPDRPFWLAH